MNRREEQALIDTYAKHINTEIPTWTEPLTLCYLADLASRSKLAMESGTYMGASAAVMLAASPDLHLWCNDKFDQLVFGTEGVTRHFLKEYIQQGRCELIVGDSERAGQMLSPYAGKFDFAFIDDGHAEEDVRRDIRCLLPLLKPGGVLCGHDWEGTNDVARGVVSLLPREQIIIPVPRLWMYIKP